MTQKIPRSALIFAGVTNPKEVIEAHAAELNAFFDRERLVEEHRKRPPPVKPQRESFMVPDMVEEQLDVHAFAQALTKYNSELIDVPTIFPMPTAAPAVDHAVTRDMRDGKMQAWPDYEIVEDIREHTVEELTLRLRKDGLLDRIAQEERLVLSAFYPPGKRRLWSMRVNEIEEDDRTRANALINVVNRNKAAGHVSSKQEEATLQDLPAHHVRQRPKEDTAFLAEHNDIVLKVRKIERAAAQAMHDVEDLDESNIDSWSMPQLDV